MKVLEREVQSQRPKKLALHIAGNDIDSPHADEDSVKEVVLKLMALCDLLSGEQCTHLSIGASVDN